MWTLQMYWLIFIGFEHRFGTLTLQKLLLKQSSPSNKEPLFHALLRFMTGNCVPHTYINA